MSTPSTLRDRIYHIFGVPFRSGSLYPGSENDAQAYRDVDLFARLRSAGRRAEDEGDIAIPSYLPHHTVPPIRNWPGPRIVWDLVGERIGPYLAQPGHIPLLIGCDCSIVVGTAQALMRSAGANVHVIYFDGDYDDAPPDAAETRSAAAMALWLLTHASPFWTGPALEPSQITVIGPSMPSQSPNANFQRLPLSHVRQSGVDNAARQALERIPASASIVLHVDIDVFQEQAFPVAFFPHSEGLTLSEGGQLLTAFMRDSRIRIIEITEYASLRDLDRRGARTLVDLLVRATEG